MPLEVANHSYMSIGLDCLRRLQHACHALHADQLTRQILYCSRLLNVCAASVVKLSKLPMAPYIKQIQLTFCQPFNFHLMQMQCLPNSSHSLKLLTALASNMPA